MISQLTWRTLFMLNKAKTCCWGLARKISALRGYEIFSPCGRRPSVHFNFTLNQLSYIPIVFVLSCTFWKKVRKTWAHGKNLHKRPLFTPHTVSPQSGTCSSLQAIACFQGAAELDLHGYTRKVIPVQIFRQSSHNGLKTSGPPLDFSTVPFRRWRGITVAVEYSANFIACNANVKQKPAPLKNTA